VGTRNLPRYRRQIGRLGLEDVARAEGPWSAEQVAKAYAAADVVALLSWYDPCSRVVLEGLRCQLPAITTIFNGAGDVLVKHGCGEVVHSPRHEGGVHAALDRLVDDRNRARLAKACKATEMELSIGRHVDELEQVYREVMGR
jgi:glycosyltransferase involved in cell wall biosynthesis